jgi:hypothetical protein
LAVCVFREANRAGSGDALQSCGDVDAVAHQVAVRFLDNVAQVNADPEFDASLGRQTCIPFDHAVLHFNRAPHRVDDAAEFDERAVAGALDDAAVVDGDRRVDEIAAQRPKPRQSPILVDAGQPAEADDIGGQDRCEFPASDIPPTLT